MFFRKKVKHEPVWLIVGLGNPGKKYEYTRHNAGFLAIDHIAKKQGVEIDEKGFDALYTFCRIGENECLLLKPQTYMNNSGQAVIQAMERFNLTPERLLVITDDVSFNVGSVRIRKNGSSGGQKGVNDIIETLGTQEFPRIKVGAGKRPEETPMVDWVLGLFYDEEREMLDSAIENVSLAVELIANGNFDLAMSKYNKTV
ncbi:MAG: aminoacyl-tRNA hydrolase [Clostridia bacterium]|nr:aminoacyl-tRNA hydrolase [Clostridia bacterium]